MEPASIRTKNPGAMWGRTGRKPGTFFDTPAGPYGVETNAPIPLKWGSTKTIYLSDGLGQGNNIAIFDTWVQGICAQLDLWRTSKNYKDKPFAEAIHTWSGGNNVPSYIAYVKQRVPGITENTIMDDAFWRGPMGLGFLKAQAGHEAGKTYPAPDEDWVEAQRRVMHGDNAGFEAPRTPPKPSKAKKAGAVIVAGGAAATVAHQSGLSPLVALAIGCAIALVVFLVWKFKPTAQQHDLPAIPVTPSPETAPTVEQPK